MQCLWPAAIKGLKLPPFDAHSQYAPALDVNTSSRSSSRPHCGRGGESVSSESVGSDLEGNQLAMLMFEVSQERLGPLSCCDIRHNVERVVAIAAH